MSKDGPVFDKFRVERTDGSSEPGERHHGCPYWVLDLRHDPYAEPAVRAYAEACRETHPVLSASLIEYAEMLPSQRVPRPSC